MPADRLTLLERAALIVLLAEGRRLTNAQLEEAGGFRLVGPARRRLVEDKLVTCERAGRSYAFELTDDGAAWCTAESASTRPPQARPLGGALYAVLRGLARTDTPLSDLFPYRADAEQGIRAAYSRLADGPGDWVGLVRLREELDGLDRAEVDAALERMAATPGVHVQAESNQRALTDAHRAAAVRFGGDDRHMIMIEAG